MRRIAIALSLVAAVVTTALAAAETTTAPAPAAAETSSSLVVRVEPSRKADASDFWRRYAAKNLGFTARRFPLLLAIREQAARESYDLLAPGAHDAAEIFYLLSLTPRGRAFLESFLPLYASGRVKIADKNSPEGKRSFIGDSKNMAFYWNGKVFLDPKADLVRLLPTFVHEGTHAIDFVATAEGRAADEVQKAYFAVAVETDAEKQQRLAASLPALETLQKIRIWSEHRAFAAQETLISDLAEMSPLYRARILSDIQRNEWLAHPIDESLFKTILGKGYKLPAPVIEEYFKLHAWSDYH